MLRGSAGSARGPTARAAFASACATGPAARAAFASACATGTAALGATDAAAAATLRAACAALTARAGIPACTGAADRLAAAAGGSTDATNAAAVTRLAAAPGSPERGASSAAGGLTARAARGVTTGAARSLTRAASATGGQSNQSKGQGNALQHDDRSFDCDEEMKSSANGANLARIAGGDETVRNGHGRKGVCMGRNCLRERRGVECLDMAQFPEDENGDALRAMAAQGIDLVSPRVVDFEHCFPDEGAARAFLAAVQSTVGEARLFSPDAEAGSGWEVQCRQRMVPTHAAITATERRLGDVAARFGGHADGWGSLSNPDGSPA